MLDQVDVYLRLAAACHAMQQHRVLLFEQPQYLVLRLLLVLRQRHGL